MDPNFEILWLLLKPHRLPRGLNSIILGVVYHPPGNDDKTLQAHLIESLDWALAANPGSGVILAGDFNQFKHRQLRNSFNLKQVVKHATRGTNILDKLFTNISKYHKCPEVIAPLGFSDHNSILFKPVKHYGNSRSFRMVRDARPSNHRLVGELLSKTNWTPLYRMQSCNNQFQYFSSTINSIVEEYLPLRRVKVDSSDKPWITPIIKNMISKRQTAWSKGNNVMFRNYRSEFPV